MKLLCLLLIFAIVQAKQPKNQGELVDYLVWRGIIKSPKVAAVMKSVDRADFVSPLTYTDWAYLDSPQPIGYGATISAPHMHAHALELLQENLKENATVLDVGSGSGIMCVLLAKMIGKNAKVYGIDHVSELISMAKANIRKRHKELLEDRMITLIEGDGRKGVKQFAPYDVIHVGAGVETVPNELLEQLAYGGIMLIPVGKYRQSIQLIRKDANGRITTQNLFDVVRGIVSNPTK